MVDEDSITRISTVDWSLTKEKVEELSRFGTFSPDGRHLLTTVGTEGSQLLSVGGILHASPPLEVRGAAQLL